MEYEASKEDIEHIREWMKKMPHIVQDYDDAFLAAFIRGSKGSLQKTKSVLENFNAVGLKYPELFGDLDPLRPRHQNYLADAYAFPLSKKLNGDTTVTLVGLRSDHKGDIDKSHALELYKYLLGQLYVLLWENNFASGKWILIFDLKNVTIAHMREYSPIILKNLMDALLTAFPIRPQGVHAVNLPPYLEWIFNLIKSFVSKKLADRIHFHSGMNTLHDYVPKEMLPKEFGGDEDGLLTHHGRWKKKIESYRSRLLEEERKMRSLDSLRVGIIKNDDMIGTFRALKID